MIKNLVQKLMSLFGVKLIRLNHARKYIPKPTIENVQVIAHIHKVIGRHLTVLQVGACDGFTSDSINEYVKAGSISAYLVEPVKLNFDKLCEFYAGVSNATLINAAVSQKDETRVMYSIKDEGRWEDVGWARQLASFYKEHLTKHDFLDSEIVEQRVACKTLSTIIKEYEISDLDVLLIDTEGFDGEVVKMAMSQNVRPNYLIFENAQLVQNYTQQELDGLYALLAENGYDWTHDRINTLAIKKQFVRDTIDN